MSTLNTTIKFIKPKMRVGRGIGSGKGKTCEEELKVKNLDQGCLLKLLRVDKCLYIEDYLKEDLILFQG